jgi:uncharacterized surface protein with fasciclin (FAS1) repeats
MITKINIGNKVLGMALLFMSLAFVACVDNDNDVEESYYTATKMTAAEFLESNSGQLGEFVNLLKRTPYFSLLSTYGEFTVFAPNNDALNQYLHSTGYGSVNNIPQAVADTLARTHIVKKGAFFTTDIGEGTLPELNMLDAYLELTLGNDAGNNNAVVYYVNSTARMVEYDDSVTNGVVHIVSSMIRPTSDLLPDAIAADSTLTLFSQALQMTGMADSLRYYIDETYVWGSDKKSLDSLYNGVDVRCTSGSRLYTDSYWPEKRYFKYTAFVEPDSVFHRHGIYTIEDLTAYAKSVYDATYPEDANLFDNDPKNRKNPLNRFVSYHLMNRICQYNNFVGSKQLRAGCWYVNLADPEEYYETMCPHTIIRVCDPPSGLYLNRKGLGDKKFSVRGVKVLSPSEAGKDRNANNGVYHYLDDILAYTTTVREEVLNCRIRIDATTLSPDFMNCNARGRYGEDKLTGFRNNYIADWKVMGTKAYVGVHSDVGYWNSYQANAVCISGIFDVTFKLPPVPSGTYEIRLGYTCGAERGVVQFYVNNEPCGIPVDLRVYGPDPTIGWVEDTDDKDENTTNDKAMRNHGFMKAMDSYRSENAEKPLRANNWNLRRILTTQYLNANEDYYLRCRQVLEDAECYWSFDYIEICPKSVYASPEGEDTH